MGTTNKSKYLNIQKGFKLNQWTVLKTTGNFISKRIVKAKCSCGEVKKQKLTDFITRSGETCNGPKHKIGRKYGKLQIVEVISSKIKNSKKLYIYLCICDCGNKVKRTLSQLNGRSFSKKEQSCGCVLTVVPKRIGPEVANFRQYHNLYRTRAKRNSIPFKINRAQFLFLTQQPCFYCNKKRTKGFNAYRGYKPFLCNGVDRLDNTKGYTIQNCVPCCHSCNRSKGSVSVLMMQQIIEANPSSYKKFPIDNKCRSRLLSIKYIMKRWDKVHGRNKKVSISNSLLLSLISAPCYYCGQMKKKNIGGRWIKMSGIDRLDSGKDYIKGNCLPCCGTCNTIKKDFSKKSAKKSLKALKNNPFSKTLKNLENINDNFKDFNNLPFSVG